MSVDATELKPCPLCGSLARIRSYCAYNVHLAIVVCTRCPISSSLILAKTKDDAVRIAVEKWGGKES
jgi:hypothetical protein